MAAVTLGPIASGLPKDIVQRLVDAEREPIRQLEAKKANEQARLKLAQDLMGKVSSITAGIKDLTKFRNFRDLATVSGRPDLMDVSVDKSIADPGSYQIEVKQLAGRSSIMSNGFEDPNETQIGAGYFSYELPSGEKREVFIDEENSSLNGMAKLINSQKDMDLHAIVVDDGTGSDAPHRLIVTHKKTGEVNDAEFPDFYFLDGDEDFYMDQEHPAQNSILKVNGFDVEFEGNKISTLLPGVTFDLKDAAPGKEFTLNIKEDKQAIKGKIQTMVDKINETLKFVQDQNKLDKDSNTRNSLGGDVTIQNLEFKIRSLITAPRETEFGGFRLADLGITFNRTGLLDIKEEKMEKAVSDNFNMVSQFFTGIEDDGTGFATELKDTITGITQSNGLIQSRVDGIKNRIKDIDHQIEMKERQITTTEQNLKEKFAKLEGTIAQMKSQGAALQSLGGGGGLLGQLSFNS